MSEMGNPAADRILKALDANVLEFPAGSEPPPQETQALPTFKLLGDLKLSEDVFWLIDETLPRGTMAMVFGPGGSGKTYLGTSIAIGLAAGDWFGREAEPSAVLYAAFERPDDAEDRLAALRDHLKLGKLPIALLKLAGYSLNQDVATHIIGEAQRLAAQEKRPVVIIIDTVSAALGGAKEDDEGLGLLRIAGERMAAEAKATILWLHHEGKADHNGPRGHLVLAEACMCWWRVQEREDGSRVVHVDKANRGPSHVPLFAFRLAPFIAGTDQRKKPIELCELQLVDLQEALASKPKARFGSSTAPKSGPKGALQKMLLAELVKLARKHPEGVEESVLRSAFIARLHADRVAAGEPGLDAKRYAQRFRQTLAPLLAREHVERPAGDLLLPIEE